MGTAPWMTYARFSPTMYKLVTITKNKLQIEIYIQQPLTTRRFRSWIRIVFPFAGWFGLHFNNCYDTVLQYNETIYNLNFVTCDSVLNKAGPRGHVAQIPAPGCSTFKLYGPGTPTEEKSVFQKLCFFSMLRKNKLLSVVPLHRISFYRK